MTLSVAGVGFDDRAQLAARVRDQLAGGSVWVDKSDYEAKDGMERALRGAGEHQGLLAELVAGHLGDGDVTVRTGAAAVAGELASILGAEPLAGLYRDHADRLSGVAPRGHTVGHPDLGWAVLIAIAGQVRPEDTGAIGLLREHAGGERGSWLLPALARSDAGWLVSNAAIVPRRSLLGVLRNLADRDHRARLIRGMAWSKAEAAEALAKEAAWRSLPFDANEIDRLRALIREEATP